MESANPDHAAEDGASSPATKIKCFTCTPAMVLADRHTNMLPSVPPKHPDHTVSDSAHTPLAQIGDKRSANGKLDGPAVSSAQTDNATNSEPTFFRSVTSSQYRKFLHQYAFNRGTEP